MLESQGLLEAGCWMELEGTRSDNVASLVGDGMGFMKVYDVDSDRLLLVKMHQ